MGKESFMDTDASILDSFLNAAEAKVQDKARQRKEKLQAQHGKNYEDFERELQPVIRALQTLPPRPGDIVIVKEAPDALGFTIDYMSDGPKGPLRESFIYDFFSGANNYTMHKVGTLYESKNGFGSGGPSMLPKTFADARNELASWIAEKIPHRLPELRAITRAPKEDDDMELDRSIKTGGTIKLKAAGNT